MDHYFTNNKSLKSDIKTITTVVRSIPISLYSDNGVFSKDKVDYGTRLLLENLPIDEMVGRALDLGCGYGIVGTFLGKTTKLEVDMIDVNERALDLAKRNIELNCLRDIRVFASDVYSDVDVKYDYIITNPPIRTGKTKVLEFLLGAFDYLNSDGELWFVMRKDHGVKSIINVIEEKYNVKIITKDKGFYIVKVTSM